MDRLIFSTNYLLRTTNILGGTLSTIVEIKEQNNGHPDGTYQNACSLHDIHINTHAGTVDNRKFETVRPNYLACPVIVTY